MSKPLPPAGSKPPRAHFLVRHRRPLGIGAAAALAALFALHAAHWHLPHRIGGIADELPLLGAALGAGALAGLLLPRTGFAFAGFGAWPAGAVAALLAFIALRAADPFVAQRGWLYAPAGCDHAVEFPRRARIVAGEVQVGQHRHGAVERAVHVAVGEATTLSAECIELGAEVRGADRARLLEIAEALLRRSAERLRLKVDRVARGDDRVVLAGRSDEGRNAANEPLVKRGEARVVLGRASLLVLWAWTVGGEGAQFPPDVARFFASALRYDPR